MRRTRDGSTAGKGRDRRPAWRKLYKTTRWRRLRAAQLRAHPMCQCPHCNEQGLEASVVDHKKRHNGDPRLFFDPRNLQSMAKTCHDRFKQSEEKGGGGFLRGCDERGLPLAAEHPWYAGEAPS